MGTLAVGLTGSIGMGKSTTAKMFAELGIPVHDADATVHELYREASVAETIEHEFPGSTENGIVDRKKLSAQVVGNPDAIKRLEAIIHPLVRTRELEARDAAKRAGAPYIIVDIPLLFETSSETRFDKIIVVTAAENTQRERVLARENMTEEKFAAILAKQMPDEQKRKRADFIVDTSDGVEAAHRDVEKIHATLLATPSAQDNPPNA
ncbi:MAG: dephospho-CoA kinase [Pseudomonadota bacterium]